MSASVCVRGQSSQEPRPEACLRQSQTQQGLTGQSLREEIVPQEGPCVGAEYGTSSQSMRSEGGPSTLGPGQWLWLPGSALWACSPPVPPCLHQNPSPGLVERLPPFWSTLFPREGYSRLNSTDHASTSGWGWGQGQRPQPGHRRACPGRVCMCTAHLC